MIGFSIFCLLVILLVTWINFMRGFRINRVVKLLKDFKFIREQKSLKSTVKTWYGELYLSIKFYNTIFGRYHVFMNFHNVKDGDISEAQLQKLLNLGFKRFDDLIVLDFQTVFYSQVFNKLNEILPTLIKPDNHK